MRIDLRKDDCLETMGVLENSSVDSILCDPPYGLEFLSEFNSTWGGKASKSFNVIEKGSMGGFTQLPNHSRVNNVKCNKCDRWKFSGTPCVCPQPDFPNARLMAMEAFEDWCVAWLKECHRVLKPNGIIRAFSGSRTAHRLCRAMLRAGFTDICIEEWLYLNGFPKAKDLSKENIGWGGWTSALKPSKEPIVCAKKGGQE